MSTALTIDTVVVLPDGGDGFVTVAPDGDPIAPGKFEVRIGEGPAVYVQWLAFDGNIAGCWWRPDALSSPYDSLTEPKRRFATAQHRKRASR